MLNQIKLFLVVAAIITTLAMEAFVNIMQTLVTMAKTACATTKANLVLMHDKLENDAKLHEIMGIPVKRNESLILTRKGYTFPSDVAYATMQFVVVGINMEPRYFETLKEAHEFSK